MMLEKGLMSLITAWSRLTDARFQKVDANFYLPEAQSPRDLSKAEVFGRSIWQKYWVEVFGRSIGPKCLAEVFGWSIGPKYLVKVFVFGFCQWLLKFKIKSLVLHAAFSSFLKIFNSS